METKTTTVRTPDGRSLCVESGGRASGRPVLVHGGTPNSRHLHDSWLRDAERRGIHLISYDRPGYGGSTVQPGRTVADCAADVRAIADALDIERFGLWGYSGGGPHALACAALLPDLVTAAATLGSIAPYGSPGLDFFAGMGEDNVEGFTLYKRDPEAARAKHAQDREALLRISPEELSETLTTLLSPVDAAALTGDLASFLVSVFRDGLAPGDQGWWDDGMAEIGPWGFALDAIEVPVQIWHGAQDRFVPVQHGKWLAENTHGADVHLSDSDGHYTLLAERVPEVHAWLLQQS